MCHFIWNLAYQLKRKFKFIPPPGPRCLSVFRLDFTFLNNTLFWRGGAGSIPRDHTMWPPDACAVQATRWTSPRYRWRFSYTRILGDLIVLVSTVHKESVMTCPERAAVTGRGMQSGSPRSRCIYTVTTLLYRAHAHARRILGSQGTLVAATGGVLLIHTLLWFIF